MIRGVSEKTIQRELGALIESGLVMKQGERRWSVYSLA
jgi:DNA-binding HxlR family transcriptional regulator